MWEEHLREKHAREIDDKLQEKDFGGKMKLPESLEEMVKRMSDRARGEKK